MPNKRIIHAHQQVAIKPSGGSTYTAVHGAQSVTYSGNSQLEQVYVLGQLEIYENIEGLPQVEASITKVLDGYPLIYCLATKNTSSPLLLARAAEQCLIGISYYNDTATSASGVGISEAEISGAFPTSVQYQFSVDGNSTETVSFQATDIVFGDDPRMTQDSVFTGSKTREISGSFSGNNDEPLALSGVSRREHILFDTVESATDVNGMIADADVTILPPEIDGISSDGVNEKNADGTYKANIQSINVNVSLNREDLLQLGRRGPYNKALTLPVESTCEISTIATSGAMVSMTQGGILTGAGVTNPCLAGGNLSNNTIRIATCEGTRLYLGSRAKRSNFSVSGGDATGGNVTISYTYNAYNTFTVMHSSNSETDGENFWTNRETYLLNV